MGFRGVRASVGPACLNTRAGLGSLSAMTQHTETHGRIPPEHQRCTAKVRNGERKGQRCRNHRSPGLQVCRYHGGVARKALERGEKKNPATAALQHGKYARTEVATKAIAPAVEAYMAAGDGLFDLTRLMARQWLALEHADLAAELAHESLKLVAEQLEKVGEAEPLALVELAMSTIALAGNAGTAQAQVSRTLNDMGRLVKLRADLDKAGGSITAAELVAVLKVFMGWVDEFVGDARIERSSIMPRLIARVEALAGGHGAPMLPVPAAT